ncbi:PaaX domain-containing protein, C- domain protein [Mycolicibacillus parakoreensis]|uniref:PaaX domain-containing protein, C- domain protein n=2 Tax=Mycobacteriaceae TaxID=1762 RepID=A0ABY3TWT0_9MYCO|nr:PaaX family transcriptional regulator C-terminal domain-containing protein [Mycolicibacillus parakoreensis]MCV7315350.1 PaaX domain-containing protein, C- domain protein [Mycolicibacillus parakoreensis]ULN52177.1 PaaX domain-containing protein, C- domain protein [Mycolicibacillus parakoreensis]
MPDRRPPRRLTARSVVLSVLLGAHPAHASAAELIRLTGDFGIRDATLRVALTRLVGSGDLIRSADGYRLSPRLLARQRRQDEALHPRAARWTGHWTTLIVTGVADNARSRAELRTTLQRHRFAALREGVWMRPDNLPIALDAATSARLRVLRSHDDAPRQLAAQLWDLSGWARDGGALLHQMAAAGDVPGRFTVAAAIVRLLLTDPVLPAELLPADWPGDRLRRAYREFVAEFSARLTADTAPASVEVS